MQAASSLIIMAALTSKAAAGEAPMFMILDKNEAGQRKQQRQLKKKEQRVEIVSSMKYDALSFICIDSKCLNYPPHAMPIYWKYRRHGASKQTMTANAKSY
jgi:hypothetical protein